LSGFSSLTTSAVITLATLAAGAAFSLPEEAMKPRLETATAADPGLGQGNVGAVPEVVVDVVTDPVAGTAGMGRMK
jgi:hypothetical protein